MVLKKFIWSFLLPIGFQKVYKDLMIISNVRLAKKSVITVDEPYLKMLYWFFSYPKAEIGLNELSSKLKMSKTTAKKAANELIAEGFLINNPYGKSWRIRCNTDHYYNYSRKISYNIDGIFQLFEQGLRDKIYKIVANPVCIILFGSYRKGDDDETSDIDIAVEVSGEANLKIFPLGKVDAGFRRNVDANLHVFSRKNVDINLFSNIANGFVLEGYLEVRA